MKMHVQDQVWNYFFFFHTNRPKKIFSRLFQAGKWPIFSILFKTPWQLYKWTHPVRFQLHGADEWVHNDAFNFPVEIIRHSSGRVRIDGRGFGSRHGEATRAVDGATAAIVLEEEPESWRECLLNKTKNTVLFDHDRKILQIFTSNR